MKEAGKFEQLKASRLKKTALFAVLCGFGSALAAVGVLLLSFKLSETPFFWAYYLLIGAGIFVLVALPLWVFLRPTAKSVARALDGEYSLGERVQTMIEYEGREGDIVRLQREDASKRLQFLPKRKTNWKKLAVCAVSALISCALFITGIALPASAEENVPDTPFEMTDWQVVALTQLIEEVKASELAPAVKAAEEASLNGLVALIESSPTTGVVRAAVESAMAFTITLREGNSYLKFAAAFETEEALSSFGKAIASCAKTYTPAELTTYEAVTSRRSSAEDKIASALSEAPAELNETVKATNNLNGVATIRNCADLLLRAVALSEVENTDALYLAITAYAMRYIEVASADGQSLLWRQSRIVMAGEEFAVQATEVIGFQVYTEMTLEFVRRRLSAIFSIPIRESETGTESGEGDEQNSGGAGNENVFFGSDDIIFDPRDGTYKKYGEVLNEYYSAVTELLRSEEISEELVKRVEEYFEILYRGFQKRPEE